MTASRTPVELEDVSAEKRTSFENSIEHTPQTSRRHLDINKQIYI